MWLSIKDNHTNWKAWSVFSKKKNKSYLQLLNIKLMTGCNVIKMYWIVYVFMINVIFLTLRISALTSMNSSCDQRNKSQYKCIFMWKNLFVYFKLFQSKRDYKLTQFVMIWVVLLLIFWVNFDQLRLDYVQPVRIASM